MNFKNKTFNHVLFALFSAIIIIQNFVPFLGYIPIGPVNLTIIHITVIVVTLTMGLKAGALAGGVWGSITLIRAFIWPTSPLDTIVFTNPFIAILPRIMIGVVTFWTFKALSKKVNYITFNMCVSAILGSLINTLLVLGQIYLFYNNHSQTLYSLNTSALLPYLLGITITNGVPEAILAACIAPSISKVLKKVYS
ncbi:ECF transporter S component [Liquorilactobacillus mali]|uniref:ECF transporter S component n=1 Tax=Liquorilactobacillus mali TaxID=1618 RepID=UPI002955944E|nr:ECF transporter S component [Liquorilactobacillus mali]MDV7757972.1 ECF transporter S component [Liquorilactobacillus mali]